MNITDLILAVAYFVGVAGSAVFVARFWFAKWWRQPEGRAIMGLHSALAYFGLLAVLRMIYGPEYPARVVLAIVGVLGLDVAVWACTFLLFRAQRGGKREAGNA